MTYWLVNSGTTVRPLSSLPGAVSAAFANWDEQRGAVHGLDRAYAMRRGDLLIYRSVGTPISRLVAYAEVLGSPADRPVLQWRFQVPRRVIAVVRSLRDGPAFALLDTAPVRMTKRLDDGTGALAVELIDLAVTS